MKYQAVLYKGAGIEVIKQPMMSTARKLHAKPRPCAGPCFGPGSAGKQERTAKAKVNRLDFRRLTPLSNTRWSCIARIAALVSRL